MPCKSCGGSSSRRTPMKGPTPIQQRQSASRSIKHLLQPRKGSAKR